MNLKNSVIARSLIELAMRILIAVWNFSGIVFTQIHVPFPSWKVSGKPPSAMKVSKGVATWTRRERARRGTKGRRNWFDYRGSDGVEGRSRGKRKRLGLKRRGEARKDGTPWEGRGRGRGGAGRLRGVKGGSNEEREPRRVGGREHRLIDSGGLVRLCLQHGALPVRARARARLLLIHVRVQTWVLRRRTRVRGYANRMIDTLARCLPSLALSFIPSVELISWERGGEGVLHGNGNESGSPPFFMTMKFKRRDGRTIRRRYRESAIQFDRKIKEHARNWFTMR